MLTGSVVASIIAPGIVPASAATSVGGGPTARDPSGNATHTLARFGALGFGELPPSVVHAAKRYVLDSFGCILSGWNTQKGRISAATMAQMGGPGAASIFGSPLRTSAPFAAFANAELLNALDYDALPHTPPVTLPALLAVGQTTGVSGRRLLAAVVAAHEMATRLQNASSKMIATLIETGKTPEVFGINTEAIIATAAAVGGMMNLDVEATSHAMGLAGYYCPPQSAHAWEALSPKTNVKYTPVGWINQGAVTAASLASNGFTSDPAILDGPMAFPRFYAENAWDSGIAVGGLGRVWTIEQMDFKAHASCRFTHSLIDCMQGIQRANRLDPAAIAQIEASGLPFVANPEPYNVQTEEGAQFSTPYVIALAAHGIAIDARCYSPDIMFDPAIRRTMNKVVLGVLPGSTEAQRHDRNAMLAKVTVTLAGGETISKEVTYPRGTGALPAFRLCDAELTAKFRDNAEQVMPAAQALRLADCLWTLDRKDNLAELAALSVGRARI
jgi:2-methylcitrate dehydratase PrpD